MKTERLILGAICGDVIGSFFENRSNLAKTTYQNTKPFWDMCTFTDDTVMTVAVMDWLLQSERNKETLIASYKKWGRKYPNAGYGGTFYKWVLGEDTEPYNSWGNGSAMRVSPVGWVAKSEEEAMELAKMTAEVTHNHPEGIKGAQAIALAIYLVRHGSMWDKDEIVKYVTDKLGYTIDYQLKDIREGYKFNVSCQGSVPQSLQCFVEGDSVEEVITNAISLGGDTDTMAAMAGSIAEAYYDTDSYKEMKDYVWEKSLPDDIKEVVEKFTETFRHYHKCCCCGKPATWLYLPTTDRDDIAFCDDCVPRGCNCNVHSIKEVYASPEWIEELKQNPNVKWYTEEGMKKGEYTDKYQSDSVYVEEFDEKGRRFPCCEYVHDENGIEIMS